MKNHSWGMMACSVLLLVSTMDLAEGQGPTHLSDVAKHRDRPVGAPRLDDICFSSRWARPLDANDPHDTFRTAKMFHATRFDWCYANDVDYIKRIKAAGYVYFGAISSELEGVGASAGREKDVHGKVIGNPELNFLMARGDVNSEAYPRIVMAHLRLLIDGGADGIQVDDPGMTYHNMLYLGGGYGDASLKLFRAYLKVHTTADQRSEWGLPETLDAFDYAGYVRSRDGNPPVPVKDLFVAFHRQSLDLFYKRIRKAIDDYAGRHVPFSCNNWSVQKQDEFPFKPHFDFWVGETSVQYGRPTAKRIYEKTKSAEALGKVQIFSPPNDGLDQIPTRGEYVALSRKLIATSYASGSATLVPWDVWRRDDGTPRFFGTRAEFGDLFDLIARHRNLFADHEEVFAVGPGIPPRLAPGLSLIPLKIARKAGDVLATIRVVPGDRAAPIVVHLVDWSDRPAGFVLEIQSGLFGHDLKRPWKARLLLPGDDEQVLNAARAADGWTGFHIPPLSPYGLVVIESTPH